MIFFKNRKVEEKKGFSSWYERITSYFCTSDYNNIAILESIKLFMATPPLRKAITLIANTSSSLPCILKERYKKELILKEKSEVLDLLKQPSPAITFKEFLFQCILNYESTGNNFFLLKLSVDGTPAQLLNINPTEISINISGGLIQRYTRTIINLIDGKESKFVIYYNRTEEKKNGIFRVAFKDEKGNELWQMKEYNPFDQVWGKSKISTLYDSVKGFNGAGEHNRKLIENGCAPSGLLISKNLMTDDEYRTFSENFKKEYRGEKNAGKVPVLQGDLEFKEMHISPREMDWINGRKFDERLIYDLYGIPQSLITNEASTYNNLFTSMFILYEHTIFPLLDKIYGELTDFLLYYYPSEKNYELYYSKENIPSLDALKTESTLNKSKSGIYTINELRQQNGLDELSEGGDVIANQKTPGFQSSEEIKNIFADLMTKDGYDKKHIKNTIKELENEGLL